MAACANVWPSATRDQLLTDVPPEACRSPSGKKGDGAACMLDFECANHACLRTSNPSCGTCGPTVPAGGSCASSQDCDYGFSCTDGKCATAKPNIVPNGISCTKHEDCGQLSYCKGTWVYDTVSKSWSIEGSGTCQLWETVGAGSACGEFRGPETTRGTRVSASILNETACVNSYCDVPAKSPTGTCKAYPNVGEPCKAEVGCGALAQCIGETCVAFDAQVCK